MFKIADLCPYWTNPPTGGGPVRVHNINQIVGRSFQVTQFSARPTMSHLAEEKSRVFGSREIEVTESYIEYQYFHPLLLGISYLLYKAGYHSDILLSPILRRISPNKLLRLISNSEIIQVEHPWLIEIALQHANGRPVIYVAHNVEALLWQRKSEPLDRLFSRLADRVRKLERISVQNADAVVVMSGVDAQMLEEIYGIGTDIVQIIPNGVDLELYQPVSRALKESARTRLGLGDRMIIIFTGTEHYPNREALGFIQQLQAEIGPRLNVMFLVVGSVGGSTASTEYLKVVGHVKDITEFLAAADIAICPLVRGSGTSLKVVEYLACGLPTIATPIATRGLDLRDGIDVLEGSIDEFPKMIEVAVQDREVRRKLSTNGREKVEREYDWEKLAARMIEVYEAVVR